MPWISKADYIWLKERELKSHEYFDRCLALEREKHELRRVQTNLTLKASRSLVAQIREAIR